MKVSFPSWVGMEPGGAQDCFLRASSTPRLELKISAAQRHINHREPLAGHSDTPSIQSRGPCHLPPPLLGTPASARAPIGREQQ